MKIKSLLAGAAMAVCSTGLPLVGLVAPARAFQFQIDSKAPYTCLQATSSTDEYGDAGAGLATAACDMTFGQQWNYVNAQILTIATGGTKVATWCLGPGVYGGLELSACSTIPSGISGINFLWGFARDGMGAVINESFEETIGAPIECLTNTGTSPGLTPCSWSDNQNWLLTDMVLAQHGSSHLCAAVEASDTTDGTPVIAYSCSGGFNKLWSYAGFGQIQGIGTANGTSTCLTASSPALGALVQLSTCGSKPASQSWSISAGPMGGTAIMLDFGIEIQGYLGTDSLCLDSGGTTKVGGGPQLIVNECTGVPSQDWDLR